MNPISTLSAAGITWQIIPQRGRRIFFFEISQPAHLGPLPGIRKNIEDAVPHAVANILDLNGIPVKDTFYFNGLRAASQLLPRSDHFVINSQLAQILGLPHMVGIVPAKELDPLPESGDTLAQLNLSFQFFWGERFDLLASSSAIFPAAPATLPAG